VNVGGSTAARPPDSGQASLITPSCISAVRWSYYEGSAIRGRTVTLKVKYADFQQINRSRTAEVPVASRAEVEAIVSALLGPLIPVGKGTRLLGVTLSSLQIGSEPRVVRQLRLPL
jgi:DNA polymerase IV